MKFRITKSEFSKLYDIFSKSKDLNLELELEPVNITAAEAVRESELKNNAFHQGYHYGWREGYYEARNNYIRFSPPEKEIRYCEKERCPFKF